MRAFLIAVSATAAVFGAAYFLLLEERAPPGARAPSADPGAPPLAGQAGARIDETLTALPYVDWVEDRSADREKRGVTKHETAAPWDGLNLFSSRPRSYAWLMDNAGKRVHGWSSRAGQPKKGEGHIGWAHVELDDEGHLYALLKFKTVMKLAWDGELIWSRELAVHHDVAPLPNGDVITLAAVLRPINVGAAQMHISDDRLIFLGPDGATKRYISIYEALQTDSDVKAMMLAHIERRQRKYARAVKKKEKWLRAFDDEVWDGTPWDRIDQIENSPCDVFHTNSVEILRAASDGAWDDGDLLVSVREMNLVVVLDDETGRVKWHWGRGELQKQHHPSQLDNGNILIFDNGVKRKYSEVIELDPVTREVVWRWHAEPRDGFFSPSRGSAQRLPNGNTLICESDRGRAFEVAKDGEVVWEYFNSDVRKKKSKKKDPKTGKRKIKKKRSAMYRLIRLDRSVVSNRPLDANPKRRAAPDPP